METKPTLAIDYGTQRIGLARSSGTLADPWRVVQRAEFASEAEVVTHILDLCAQEKILQIVVGISENTMAQKTLKFIDELKRQTELPVFTTDETLSSQDARKKLRSAKLSKRQGPIDHYAAAEFLQEWLDSN
jgi:putative transcription antitermination factor YqgF